MKINKKAQKILKCSGRVVASKDKFDIVDCQKCGFIHILPLIETDESQEFYSNKFYQKETKDYIKRHVNDYEWLSIEYNEKYDLFDKNLKRNRQKRILDIGSGPGLFLKVGEKRGWEVLGFEPGKPAYHFSKNELNLNIKNEFFDRKTFNKYGRFDVVHLNNVIEHILDPIDMLTMATEVLEEGGLICVTCPNDFNPLQLIVVEHLKKDKWWVVPEHHINYFNICSLKNLFNNLGLVVFYETASFPLELFLLMGEDYIGNDKVGRKMHKYRMKMEKVFNDSNNNDFKRKIFDQFAEIGIGRELTMIGKKND